MLVLGPSRRPIFTLLLAACALMLILGIALVLFTRSGLTQALGVALVTGAWFFPALTAVRYRTKAQFRKTASGDEVRLAQKATIRSVDKTRQTITTGQNRQERTLARIEEHVRGLTATIQSHSFQVGEPGIDVLFVTSNGAGLGHISRSLAIARQLPAGRNFEILTLSSAFRRAAALGVTVHYFPSSGASGVSSREWNQHFRAHVFRLLEKTRPRVVVFDGTWVYTALTEVCRMRGIPLIWIQRGMWKQEVDATSGQRHFAAKVVDQVIVPGDFAGEETVDVGPGITPQHVEPIILTARDDMVGRNEACRRLDLDPAQRYVLLNLGGGGVSDPSSLASTIHQLLEEAAPDLIPVQVVSPLAASESPGNGLIGVHSYPVMPYAQAFEFMISAAGYNSAQEAVALGIPSILIPNIGARTDDQLRRAEMLDSRGFCLAATDIPGMKDALEKMLNPEQRASMRRRLEVLEEPRGAHEAADLLEDMILQSAWTAQAATVEGDINDGL